MINAKKLMKKIDEATKNISESKGVVNFTQYDSLDGTWLEAKLDKSDVLATKIITDYINGGGLQARVTSAGGSDIRISVMQKGSLGRPIGGQAEVKSLTPQLEKVGYKVKFDKVRIEDQEDDS